MPAASNSLDAIYGKISRRILPLLLIGYIVAYLDRVNVGFAKLQMLESLHFSQTVYGLGAGIFFIGYFLFEVPSNLALHRIGARRWLARIMISWGIVSAMMLVVTTPTQFYALRFVLGAAEAGFFPGVIFYLTRWYPSTRRGKVTALFMTGIPICGVIGSLLSGWIMERFDGVYGLGGWQWLFLLEALPAILIGFVLFFRLDDNRQQARWLSDEEKLILTADLEWDAGAQSEGTLRDALRDGRVWFGCLIYFCAVIGLYGISFWMPTILSDMGVKNPLHIGMLTAVPYAVGGVGMVLVGRSSDRHGERRWHIAIPAALGALGLALSVVFADNTVLAMFALTLATFGTLTVPPLFWSIPTAFLRGAAAAAGIAVINSFGNLAGFVGPYAVGWIRDVTGSTGSGIYLVAVCGLLSGVLVLIGAPHEREWQT